MIKAIVIDDEPLAASIVKNYLENHPSITVVQECGNGFEGLKAILQHRPELIFLDVQMPKINGFEMLELLDEPPAVIFTTAFDEYALKAFEAHAVDYLLKPFSRERFDKAVQKWMSLRTGPEARESTRELLENAPASPDPHRVVVRTGSHIRIIPLPDIHYIEACDDYVKIHTAEGSFLKKKTMQHFEQTLPSGQFVRVHRSFILQVQQITRIEPMGKESYSALLKSGTRIALSKSGYTRLKDLLGL
jgi:two-component system, LytTR family, response regulator